MLIKSFVFFRIKSAAEYTFLGANAIHHSDMSDKLNIKNKRISQSDAGFFSKTTGDG